MERKFESMDQPGHITKANVPDDDMPSWINTLKEGGFSDEEMDYLLSYLNKTYRQIKGSEVVERELENTEKYLREKYGRRLNPEQRQCLRKGIESRFDD